MHQANFLNSKPAAPTEEFRHVLEVNVLALCAFTREVIKDMRDRKVDDGHVVHINRYIHKQR
jgi:NAD(P)-dependent dehydrogenase (short-subunit alcohol dehydrogenase family)